MSFRIWEGTSYQKRASEAARSGLVILFPGRPVQLQDYLRALKATLADDPLGCATGTTPNVVIRGHPFDHHPFTLVCERGLLVPNAKVRTVWCEVAVSYNVDVPSNAVYLHGFRIRPTVGPDYPGPVGPP